MNWQAISFDWNQVRAFLAAAEEGSFSGAARVLKTTQPTVGRQIGCLDEALGVTLVERSVRGLTLTEAGRVVMRYAEDIFSAGMELSRMVGTGSLGASPALRVGITDSIAKLVAYRILRPAMEPDRPVRIVCEEARLDSLIGDLAVHRLDLIVSEAPLAPGSAVKAWNHLLGQSEVGVFATPAMARRFRRHFPKSLDGAPFLLPAEGAVLRRSLEQWFDACGITPAVVAECSDSALLKSFGSEGVGLFAGPMVIAESISAMYGVTLVGQAAGINESYYAISPERRIRQSAVLTICEQARHGIFS